MRVHARGVYLLVGLWNGKEHEDGTRSGEDCEEPKDPTPGHTGNSHKPSDHGRNLPNTKSEGYMLNNGCFRRLTVGPANGPRAKNDKAFPRTVGSHKSPSRALQQSCKLGARDEKDGKTYPLLVRGAAAKNPPRKRKISKAAALGANALPT